MCEWEQTLILNLSILIEFICSFILHWPTIYSKHSSEFVSVLLHLIIMYLSPVYDEEIRTQSYIEFSS